jgi:hypothetical protein
MAEFSPKAATVLAWNVLSVTEDNVPAELQPYVDGQRLTFHTSLFQVVNVTGALVPESTTDYLVLADDKLFFLDNDLFALIFEVPEPPAPDPEPEVEEAKVSPLKKK